MKRHLDTNPENIESFPFFPLRRSNKRTFNRTEATCLRNKENSGLMDGEAHKRAFDSRSRRLALIKLDLGKLPNGS